MNYISVSENLSILTITINRPKELNALNSSVLKELDAIIDGIDVSKVRCLLINGGGEKSFVAGADISEMCCMTRSEALDFSRFGNSVLHKLSSLSIPTIAVVNGYALGGGCELALACDIRLASEKAVFGQPETSLGITPGFGGTQRLARTVGASQAKYLIFTGKRLKAQDALKIGLVDAVFPDSELYDSAFSIATTIAQNAPIAVKNAKRAINNGIDLGIEDALAGESEAFSNCFETLDQHEGMEAFLEKRPHKEYQNR